MSENLLEENKKLKALLKKLNRMVGLTSPEQQELATLRAVKRELDVLGYWGLREENVRLKSALEKAREALADCMPSWLPEKVRDKRRTTLSEIEEILK